MKATGIVRRIDDLGRVVIPKEIRRTLRIREGDPLEIFVDRDGGVILKKYSPIGELGDFAQEYADSLHDSLGHVVCIADRDVLIAVSGGSKKELLGKNVGNLVNQAMEDRMTINTTKKAELSEVFGVPGLPATPFTAVIVAPIVAQGDPIGAVLVCSKEEGVVMGNVEQKMAETAAGFLAKQMEQ